MLGGELAEHEQDLAALVVGGAKPLGGHRPLPQLAHLREQIALRAGAGDKAEAGEAGLFFGELAGARPLDAPEVGVDHNAAVKQPTLAQEAGDVEQHRLTVLARARADLDDVVAGEVGDHVCLPRRIAPMKPSTSWNFCGRR